MTTLDRPPVHPLQTSTDLLLAQLAGIDRWHAARQATERAAKAPGLSREQRLDAVRRLGVREREHAALIERCAAALESSGAFSTAPVRLSAVVANRHPWTRERLASELAGHGVDVLVVVDNGAEAVGACIAEQPALLVVDEPLAMISGSEAVAEVAQLCEHTVRAGYVADELQAERLRRAGAVSVLTRKVPPADVAAEFVALLAG